MVESLPIGMYRNFYDPSTVVCTRTDLIKPLDEIVGQDRALRALKFGFEIKEAGFNIYVAGIHGTGRMSAVRNFLEEYARGKPKADDWIYLNNFSNPYEPKVIRLPGGRAKQFEKDMVAFISEARKTLPKAFESEDYAKKRTAAIRSIDEEKARLVTQQNASALQKGFVLQMGPAGLASIPIIDGKPLSQLEFDSLPPETQEAIQQQREELNAELMTTFRKMKDLDTHGTEVIENLNREISLYAIGHLIADIKEKFKEIPAVLAYIDAVQNDILNNLEQFLGVTQQPQVPQQVPFPYLKELPFRKYEVNVVVDNGTSTGAPVVVEQNPTYQNLFGKMEKEVQFGFITTDFTMIRPGSVHKANGGYLVLPVEDLLRNPFAWDGIKTALKMKVVTIEEPGERMGFITTKSIKPEPVPLDVKVILIGSPQINQLLFSLDPDFHELFKVKADFDTVMDRNEENAAKYAGFICMLCRNYNLKHLDNFAVAKVVEYGSRLAEDQHKLSTRFSIISDIVKEASFYATQENAETTSGRHIVKAIEEKIYRSNLIQEKIEEYIKRGIFLIETDGMKVGQVNGLSVISLGDFMFGRPSRVTASVGMGREGIMDIERQAQMGGPIHTKGVLILSGYLAGKYAQDKPLSLSARLVFEQSYEGVEGDSASSTELYAILSALSGRPIKQSIAVTGSVNQKGEVQAIGGVNEKLEGFYEVCKAKGLDGNQGAMIPASNVQNLMLKEELVDAAKAGKFRIYPVSTIDEGIEVLTGTKAGERRPDGTFEEGTVNYLVDQHLREMAEKYREFQPIIT